MEVSMKLHTIKSGWSIEQIEFLKVFISKKIYYCIFSQNIYFVWANSVVPDKIPAFCGSSLFDKVPV